MAPTATAHRPARPGGVLHVLWKREIIGTLRMLRSYVMLFLMTGLLIFSVSSMLTMAQYSANTAMFSQVLMPTYIRSLLWAAVLLLPPLAAVSLSTERQRDCLDLLLAAPIRARDIVLAKTASLFTFYLLLAIGGLPVAGVVFFLVGIDWIQFLQGLWLSLMTALTCISIGVRASAAHTDSAPAVGDAYARIFLFLGIPSFFVSVFHSTAASMSSGLFGGVNGLYLLHTLLQGTIIILCLSTAANALKKPARAKKPVSTLKLPIGTLIYFLLPKRFFAHPAMRNRHLPRLKSDLGPGCAIVIYALIAVPFGFFAWVLSLIGIRDGVLFWALTCGGISALVIPGLVATRITREYEEDTMNLFRMTLLTPRDIIAGQVASAVLALTPLLLGLAIGCLVFIYQTGGRLADIAIVLYVHAALLAILFTWLCVSQSVVILCKKSARALLLGYGALFFAVLCNPVIFIMRSGRDLADAAPVILVACVFVVCPALLAFSISMYSFLHTRDR